MLDAVYLLDDNVIPVELQGGSGAQSAFNAAIAAAAAEAAEAASQAAAEVAIGAAEDSAESADAAAESAAAALQSESAAAGSAEDAEGYATDAGNYLAGVTALADDFDFTDLLPLQATSRTIMRAFTGMVVGRQVLLSEAGREGLFAFDSSDLSAEVTVDPNQGIYVAPDTDPTGASGAWARRFEGAAEAGWFGFVNDDDGIGGTDNLAAWNALMAFGAAFKTLGGISGFDFVYSAPFPVRFSGSYYFSDTISVHLAWDLFAEGAGNGIVAGAHLTRFRFAADKHGIIFNYVGTHGATYTGSASDYGSTGSCLRNISVLGAGTDTTKHGIIPRDKVRLENTAADGFPGNNYHFNATATGSPPSVGPDLNWGNCNCCIIDGLTASHSGRHAIYTGGTDANAMTFNNVNILSAGCGGIIEDSSLGNNYSSANVHGGGSSNLGGVTHGGRHYVLISNAIDAGKDTTPGTNAGIWYDLGAGSANAQYPAWSGSGTYVISCSMWTRGLSNRSSFHNPYIEGIGYISHARSPGCVFGPNLWESWTQSSAILYSNNGLSGQLVSPLGVGSYKGNPEDTTYGNYVACTVGGEEGTVAKAESQSGGTFRVKYQVGRTYMTWDNLGGSATWFYSSGAPLAGATFGRSAPQSYVHLFSSFALGADETAGRIVTFASAAPAAGDHARGEIVFNNAPSAGGTVGWVCTTAGTPGTWKTFGAIAA